VLASVCVAPRAFGSTAVQQNTGRIGSGAGKTSWLVEEEEMEEAGL